MGHCFNCSLKSWVLIIVLGPFAKNKLHADRNKTKNVLKCFELIPSCSRLRLGPNNLDFFPKARPMCQGWIKQAEFLYLVYAWR